MRNDKPGWALLLQNHDGWQCVPLGARTILGRASDCDVVLSAPGVAAQQCRLVDDGARLLVTNLGKDQSTCVGDQPLGLRPFAIEAGGVLRMGRQPAIVVRHSLRHGEPWLQLGELGSASPAMWHAMAGLALAASSPWPLLLQGESGCGKELAARLVHTSSARAERPWVAVNCAALHGDTLLAELFGAMRGAYTGCLENRKGAFERADGGTLFLDEVGELSPVAQATLLRALESGEIQVLGGPVRQVDVRLVCATNRDLAREVSAGRFRLDLLHRLSVTETRLPPLRARPCDLVPLLEDHLDGLTLPQTAGDLLRRHGWPGNVRELRNIARRLQIISRYGVPTLAELREAMGLGWHLPAPVPSGGGVADGQAWREDRPVTPDARRACVSAALASAANVADAWRQSGLPRGTFFRYLKQVRSDAVQLQGLAALCCQPPA